MSETDPQERYRGRTTRGTSYERFDRTWRPQALIVWSVDGCSTSSRSTGLADEMFATQAEVDAKAFELARAWVDQHA